MRKFITTFEPCKNMRIFVLFCFLICIILPACNGNSDDSSDADICLSMDDPNFIDYCYRNLDINKDGKVTQSEANAVSELKMNNIEIASFKGIEYFINLRGLIYSPANNYNKSSIEYITLEHNTALITLELFNTDLQSINIKNNTKLETIKLTNNALINLDLSNNKALKYLACANNNITSLDLTNNTNLEILYCSNNRISTLDVSNCAIQFKIEKINDMNLIHPALNLDNLPLRKLILGKFEGDYGISMWGLGPLYNNEFDRGNLISGVQSNNLEVDGSEITWLEFKNSPDLKTLDLSQCPKLDKLRVDKNTCKAFETVYLKQGVSLTILDIPTNAKVIYK